MAWTFVIIYSLMLLLTSCTPYSDMQRDFAQGMYPDHYKAQEARDAKKGK